MIQGRILNHYGKDTCGASVGVDKFEETSNDLFFPGRKLEFHERCDWLLLVIFIYIKSLSMPRQGQSQNFTTSSLDAVFGLHYQKVFF